MKRTTNLLFAILLWLVSSTPVMTQTVNTNRFISINVVKGQQIKLDFAADQAATPVKIVSGSGEYNPTVGTSWSGMQNYLADDSVMTVYGDITKFDCSGNYNNITGIDLSHNTIITWFSCGKNSLQDLIVSSNKALKELYCYNNSIKTLNLDSTTELTKLSCARNSISSLDLSHNKKLKWLNCSDNRLTGLDVSSNILLEKIICHKNNSLSTQALDRLYCSLPDRTGTFSGYIEPIYDDSSPNDSVVLATNSQNALDKNWKVKYAFDETDIPATTGSYTCTTLHDSVNMDSYITLTVADGAYIYLDFRAAADNTHIRIVSGSNIQNITIGTDWLSLASYIADGTEMKIYGDVTVLDCRNNGANIQALDVTKNTALTELYCHRNQLTALDVSKNTALTVLYCHRNQLTALDVTKNTALTTLYCYENQLTALDITKNTALITLYCNGNQLTALDVTKNTALTTLSCYNNQITALDITKDTVLKMLYCNENRITTLDVTKNTALTELYCHKNQLTTLDVTKNTDLVMLYCNENRLTALDVTKNTALTTLYCNENQLTSLDVSKNTALITLYCYKNQLTALDVTKNTDLVMLYCNENQLTALDVSKNTALTILGCYNNQITALDITKDTVLTTLYCNENQLTTLDVTKNIALTKLYCYKNQLTALDVTKNIALTELYCYENRFTTLDVTKNTALEVLGCYNNQIKALDVTKNTALTKLYCYNNPQLNSLNIVGNNAIKNIYIYGCNFSACGLDSIFRDLPQCLPTDSAKILIKSNASTNPGTDGCRDTIASHRNWAVLNFKGNNSMDTIKNSFYTCVPNMNLNRAIRLGVASGQTISVAIKAAANNTHIRFTCGSTDTILTVGTSWSYWQLPAKADSMVFFGDITRFNCSMNGNNITAISTKTNPILEELQCIGNAISTLDLSHNVELSELYCLGNRLTSLDLSHNHKLTKLACYDNPQLQHIDVNGCYPLSRVVVYGCNLSDCGLDSLLRALPRRSSDNKGKIFIKDGTSTNPGSGGCQDTIASHKNWVVLDYNGGSPDTIANTHYTCAGNLNLNRAIRLGVVSGQTISVAIKAAANNTHIRVISGATDTILTVGLSWKPLQLPARADSMVFFGDITRFNCNTNGNNITAISTKTNTILEELRCIGNAISTLDLSHNVELSELYCLGNRLTSLDLSHNHKLTELACYDNPQLQHIDVNGCYPLSRVVVYGCNLSDCGLDSLLRALPRRSSDNKGKIFIKDGTSTNPGSSGCQDTIASHKNWVVLDYNGGSPDTIANTHYTCADTPTDNDRHLTNETDIKIYPNPVADILYLSATASTIHIYDIYGIEVARAIDTDKVGVSHLPDGVYIVRADGTVAKMVKQ